jgi:hypothetical protein
MDYYGLVFQGVKSPSNFMLRVQMVIFNPPHMLDGSLIYFGALTLISVSKGLKGVASCCGLFERHVSIPPSQRTLHCRRNRAPKPLAEKWISWHFIWYLPTLGWTLG